MSGKEAALGLMKSASVSAAVVDVDHVPLMVLEEATHLRDSVSIVRGSLQTWRCVIIQNHTLLRLLQGGKRTVAEVVAQKPAMFPRGHYADNPNNCNCVLVDKEISSDTDQEQLVSYVKGVIEGV